MDRDSRSHSFPRGTTSSPAAGHLMPPGITLSQHHDSVGFDPTINEKATVHCGLQRNFDGS